MPCGDVELQDKNGEFHAFQILATSDRLVFGGACNSVFLESGYLSLRYGETMRGALAELIADLCVYYRDGAQYVSRIVCNDRM